jgi:hypothetical protein
MNEQRIKAFADHADRYAYSISDSDPSVNWYKIRDEKFAELIVEECTSIAAHFSMENKRFHPDIDPANLEVGCRMVYFSTCWAVADEIKEHFGVEE